MYNVVFSERGRSDLAELGRSTACIILSWITEHLEECKNPRVRGKNLTGESGRWKFKVGRYRILAEIQERTITVLAITDGQGFL